MELLSGLLYVGIMYRFLYAPYLPVDRVEDLNRVMTNFDNLATILFLFKSFLFVSFLLMLAVIDIDHQLLPNRLTLSGAVIGILLGGFRLPSALEVFPMQKEQLFAVTPMLDGFLQAVLGMLIGGGIILLIAVVGYLIYKRPAMGLGDVKLAAFIGAFVGITNIGPALFSGFVFGGVFGLIFIFLKIAGMKSLIPFGPYLCLGGLLAFMFGPNMLKLWLG